MANTCHEVSWQFGWLNSLCNDLTHWGRVTHICVSKLTIIVSDNGLPPGRRQAIIWTNAGILLFGLIGTNFREILVRIQTFSFKKLHLKTSSAKWRLFYLGLNGLKQFPWFTGHAEYIAWYQPSLKFNSIRYSFLAGPLIELYGASMC